MTDAVRTAGQIVADLDAAGVPDQARLTPELGTADGVHGMVNMGQLGAMLRWLRPATVDIRVTSVSSWWTLTMPLGDISVAGESMDEVADAAVAALRAWAARDSRGAAGDVETWLVHASTDDELRAWLGLPARHQPTC